MRRAKWRGRRKGEERGARGWEEVPALQGSFSDARGAEEIQLIGAAPTDGMSFCLDVGSVAVRNVEDEVELVARAPMIRKLHGT